MDVFPSIHNDDIATKPVGYIQTGALGLPVYLWFTDITEKREAEWRREVIRRNREAQNG